MLNARKSVLITLFITLARAPRELITLHLQNGRKLSWYFQLKRLIWKHLIDGPGLGGISDARCKAAAAKSRLLEEPARGESTAQRRELVLQHRSFLRPLLPMIYSGSGRI